MGATKKKNSQPQGGSSRMELKKSKGQHLLKNPGVVDKIVLAAKIKASDTVLEIGPGTGNLTMKILPLAKKVIAMDIDGRMVAEVRKRAMALGFSNLDVRTGDALKSNLGNFDICAANLPYQISSPFVFKLLAHRPKFRAAVLMFQREFAERLLAQAGDKNYCRLSVNTQIHCSVTRVCKVAPGSFNPPPKVESMVVRLVPRQASIPVEFPEWDGLLRICFCRKNRTLRAAFNNTQVLNTLQTNYKARQAARTEGNAMDEEVDMKALVFGILDELSMSDERSVSINIERFLRLLLAFHKKQIFFSAISVAGLCGDDDNDESMHAP